MNNKVELILNWYDDVWVKGELDAIDTYFKPGAAAEGIVPDLALNTEDMAELVTAVRARLGPMQINLLHSVEQNDWLACLLEVKSTIKGSNDPVHAYCQIMVRYDEGKIAEAYNLFDFLTFFEHLGQLPPQALPQMLSGAVLR